jgi:hypothetical protein
VQLRGAVVVEAFDVASTEVRKTQPSTRIRNDDLSGVQVPGEHEVKDTRDALHDSREVAQKDPQVRPAIRERVRSCASSRVPLRVDADDLNASTTQLDLDVIVAQECDVL